MKDTDKQRADFMTLKSQSKQEQSKKWIKGRGQTPTNSQFLSSVPLSSFSSTQHFPLCSTPALNSLFITPLPPSSLRKKCLPCSLPLLSAHLHLHLHQFHQFSRRRHHLYHRPPSHQWSLTPTEEKEACFIAVNAAYLWSTTTSPGAEDGQTVTPVGVTLARQLHLPVQPHLPPLSQKKTRQT